MGNQGQTAINKVNIINMIKGLIYLGIPSNMTGFCKLVAQNWHKKSPLVRACSDFSCGRCHEFFQNLQGLFVRVSDCEELVGVTHRG